ncbi:hypothetical protein AVEN_22225-1 [Araneus ventricosus]|uniref:Uncharacterized protein n=1 Tax=Araneus ventricosus TaxID=182803 RepID=A0A4Y2VU34_ARAVE|nr:hypothetical protein AVEN_22225-1 [Araneus ventricosus]
MLQSANEMKPECGTPPLLKKNMCPIRNDLSEWKPSCVFLPNRDRKINITRELKIINIDSNEAILAFLSASSSARVRGLPMSNASFFPS